MGQVTIPKNINFFCNRHRYYGEAVAEPGTYGAIRTVVGREVLGAKRLLDLGHGLVFNYDVRKIASIVALDLFTTPTSVQKLPKKIEFVKGTALDLKFPDRSFDTVLMDMLLHHLVGKNPHESESNVRQAIAEAFRVLKPRGRLIIVESYVPWWLYRLEKLLFSLVSRIVDRFLSHPMVLQYPVEEIEEVVRKFDSRVRVEKISKSGWILQFGFRFPAILSPIQPWLLVAKKPGGRTRN